MDPPSSLPAKHQRIAHLVAAGLPRHEVARLTGYSEATVTLLGKSPLFQAVVAGIVQRSVGREAEVASRTLREAAPDAATRMVELGVAGSKDDAVRFRATAWLLERVVGKAEDPGARARSWLPPEERARLEAALAEDDDVVEGEVVKALEAPLPQETPVESLEEARAWAVDRAAEQEAARSW